MDYFFFSGELARGRDLEFVETVAQGKSSDMCTVIMTSGGGDPDAAYKIARYLHYKYGSYAVMVSGYCKSAATLFAHGASEIFFCPFGELGPLVIQLQKEDKLGSQESGLNISEAFSTLERQTRDTYQEVLFDTIGSSRGVISFKTASEVTNSMVSALYGPIFAQIEPEELGSRVRAMRIGADYAKRLDVSSNLQDGGLDKLVNG